MSLILDALKKVQKEAGSPRGNPFQGQKLHPTKHRFALLGVVGGIILCGIIFGVTYGLFHQQAQQSIKRPTTITFEAIPEQSLAGSPQLPPAALQSSPQPIVSLVEVPLALNPKEAQVPQEAPKGLEHFIENIFVGGIVTAPDGSARALLNGQVYYIKDIVESEEQLKLTAVEPGELTFTNKSGEVYTKAF